MASATLNLHTSSLFTSLAVRGHRNRSAPTRVFSPLRRLQNGQIPRRVSTRCSTSPDPLSTIHSHLPELRDAVSPSVVALLSYFSGPPNQEIPHSARRGTGVFVDPTLIVTSARLVGRVSTVYNSERGSVLHNCFIARTIALTMEEKVLRTTPVAVNFAGDVAVLEVVKPEGKLPPPCAVANGVAEEGSPLLGIARHENCTGFIILQARGEAGRGKAPWPLDDELGWVDYGAGEPTDNVVVSIADISGSPWFNYEGEVVGMASWAAAAADKKRYVNSYAVPPSRISSVVDYAKTKGPHDPIVMDPWINALTIPDLDADIAEKGVPQWTNNVSVLLLV